MRISVRRIAEGWSLAQAGFAPGCFNLLGEALYEATLRFRSATRGSSSSLSISCVGFPQEGSDGHRLEPGPAP
jgi:hypothetical protein